MEAAEKEKLLKKAQAFKSLLKMKEAQEKISTLQTELQTKDEEKGKRKNYEGKFKKLKDSWSSDSRSGEAKVEGGEGDKGESCQERAKRVEGCC